MRDDATRTRLLGLLDRLLPPLYRLIGRLLRVHAFAGARLMPNAHRALDEFDIACVPYHYYQPVYNVADLPERTWTDQDPLLGLDMNLEGQLALLKRFDYDAELLGFPWEEEPGDALGFYYNNGSPGWRSWASPRLCAGAWRTCRPRPSAPSRRTTSFSSTRPTSCGRAVTSSTSICGYCPP